MSQRPLFPDESDEQPDARPPEASRSRVYGVPHSGSQTSRNAAERIAPVATAQAARVFHAIAAAGADGRTDHELQQLLGMTGDSERPRRWSLQRAGLIRDSGQRRKSPAGRAAIVWIATDAALPAAVASPKPTQVS